MSDLIKCTECNNMILPRTAKDNDGLCGQCVKISPEFRAARREFEQRVASGLVFRPSDEELATSSSPNEIMSGGWLLQPEFYAETNVDSVVEAIDAAKSQPDGNVFLVTEDGGQLNLGFARHYAVREYQNMESGEFRYAYCAANLSEQVAGDDHVIQACLCCGVGLLWYPSRYHMPRDKAFVILENAVANRATADVQWLDTDDFSHTDRGRG